MVEYLLTNATVTPMRQEPSEHSEQLTQLLLGEPCQVLDRLPRWIKVRSLVDGQEGWVDFKMLSPADSSLPLTNDQYAVVATPMATASSMDGGADLLLTLGTCLSNYSHGTFKLLDRQYIVDPNCVAIYQRNAVTSNNEVCHNRHDIVRIALSLLNAPYLWGGKNLMGMDCSGFTQVVYAAMGINLLRNAREQITQGIQVPSLLESLPGDLAFFDHADRDPHDTRISHVGLLLSPTEIIHCSGCVHIDTIDENGIHLADGQLTHHLVAIRRYF